MVEAFKNPVLLLQVFCEIARSSPERQPTSRRVEVVAARLAAACTEHFVDPGVAHRDGVNDDWVKLHDMGGLVESIRIRWALDRLNRLYPGMK